jgi:hypothetical protein
MMGAVTRQCGISWLHTSANFVFVRRPHDLNGASASGASQIELIATEGRLF